MCAKSADEVFQKVAGRLAAARRLLIVSHARPDGDGLGSMAALAFSAEQAGKAAEMALPGDVPPMYEFILAGRRPHPPAEFAALAAAADLVVVVDTCALSQLEDLAGPIQHVRDKVAVIDHHATADDVGAVRWIDPTAAAAGVMMLELLESLGWAPPAAAVEALFVAIATDTGWFRFANTDARCLRAAARLLEQNLAADRLYRRLYQSDRPERLALMRRMLESLELHADGRLAAMTLRRHDFQLAGARHDETENLVNEALRIGTVEAVVLLVEGDDCIRVNLRSRGRVDVAAIARRFGGGGHVQAAGLRQAADIDALRQQLVQALAEALAQTEDA